MVSARGQVQVEIHGFIVTNFLIGKEDTLSDDSSFLELGIIDSTGILELVSYLEESYGIKVEDDELIPENLDSVCHVAGYIQRKAQMEQAQLLGSDVGD